MNIIYILFLLIITIICVKKEKFSSPLAIFLILWSIVQILHVLNIFERPEISLTTWLMVNTGIFMYIIGYFSYSYKFKQKSIETKEIIFRNDNLLIFLTIIAILAILPTFTIQFKNFLNGNSFVDNKHLLMSGEVTLNFLYVYFGKPMRIILSMIAAIMIISKRKNYKFIFLVIILMFIDYICTGSKNIFFTWGIYILILLIVRYNSSLIQIILRHKKPVIFAVASIVFILYIMSGTSNVAKKLYFYISGNLSFFDYSLNNINSTYPDYTFGFLSFNGLLRIPFIVMNALRFDVYPSLLLLADDYLVKLEDFIYLNENTIFNSFSTIFFNFYLDFGWFGIIFGMFLFGMISSKIYYELLCNGSTYNYLKYMFLFNVIINSLAKSVLTSPSYGMALLFLFLIFKPILNKRIIYK